MKTLPSCPRFAVVLGLFLLCGSRVCPASDAAWCQASDLTLKTMRGSAAAGTLMVLYAFQNQSAKSCGLSGFPSLRALNKDGKTIHGVEFKRDPEICCGIEQPPVPSRIILEPGEEVWFQFIYTTAGVYHDDVEDRSICHRIETLLVAPPRSRKWLAAHFGGEVCNPVRFTRVFWPIPEFFGVYKRDDSAKKRSGPLAMGQPAPMAMLK